MPEMSPAAAQASVLLGRGVYLHASAVLCKDGGVILVTGSSGSGKSTLAILMHRSGFPALADDTVAVFRNTKGRILVQPSLGDCLWNRRLSPSPLRGIVFVEKGRRFGYACIGNRYSYYRLLRDGGLWTDVYRLYNGIGEYALSRKTLRGIVEETPCYLVGYSHQDPHSLRRVMTFINNGF